MTLDPVQQRVLGALIEKEIATPETYPLSLNALGNACNQRSSRDPVMELSEADVREALDGLEAMGLTAVARDSRVPKYEHRIRTVLSLRRDETAILCLLLLRGPQTPGELRARADRLYTFDDLEAVQSTLERLASRPPGELPGQGPLVSALPRQPGSREVRYVHLLGTERGPTESSDRSGPASESQTPIRGDATGPLSAGMASKISGLEERITLLATVVEALEGRVASLEAIVADPSPQ